VSDTTEVRSILYLREANIQPSTLKRVAQFLDIFQRVGDVASRMYQMNGTFDVLQNRSWMGLAVDKELDGYCMKLLEVIWSPSFNGSRKSVLDQPATPQKGMSDVPTRKCITYAVVMLPDPPLKPSCRAPKTASRSASSSRCFGSFMPSTQQS